MKISLSSLLLLGSLTFAQGDYLDNHDNSDRNEINSNINTALEALNILKKYKQINHKYEYQIPKGESMGNTFFHEYFYYGHEYNKTELNKNLTSGDNGYLIEISDNSHYFFDIEDIESYGSTDFDLPYGPLRHIEEDCFDEVLTNWTFEQKEAFNTLENLALQNDLDALRILADFYSFGFLDLQVDLKKAIDYYKRILEVGDDIKTQGHAHFMLGVFYSTGLFGKVEKNSAKGLIHYNFAADLGNIQAQMALAHKYMFGISVTRDYPMAIFYFSLAFQKSEEFVGSYKTEIIQNKTESFNVTENLLIYEPPLDKFGICWSDALGGLYGDKTSESSDSLRYFEKFTDYEKIKKYSYSNFEDSTDYSDVEDDTLDAYTLFYFATQKNYHGDYLHARDYNTAFKYAEICVNNGFQEPEIQETIRLFEDDNQNTKGSLYDFGEYHINIQINDDPSPLSIFIGRCSQYLGHMYMRGQGTEVDYDKALHYLKIGKTLSSTYIFRNDIGLINYYGLGIPKDVEKGKAVFKEGSRLASSRYYTANALLDEFNENLKFSFPTLIDNNIYTLLSSSATYNTLARRKLIELYENGKLNMNYETMAGYYNSYLKSFENLYFDFRIPFFAYINAKENDTTSNDIWTALVGMAIESELGYETAQASLGSILYPTLGKYKSRKFRNSKEIYSKVYTPKRFQEAISYFELSARHLNRDSINFLGDMYYNGLYSVPGIEDPMWNKKWWMYILPVSTESINDSILISMIEKISDNISTLIFLIKTKFYNLFDLDNRIKVNEAVAIIPRDLSKSISYYQDSASMWSQIGSYNIGWAYEYGIGVSQDLHLAKRHYDNVLTVSDTSYISVKFAILRVQLKAMLWNYLGCDSYGVKELGMEQRTWKQRLTMIVGWFMNRE